MQTIVIKGTLEAISPIVHFGDEKTGSSPILHTIPVYVPSLHEIIDLPVISGNGIRGMLRRLLIADFLDQIGYTLTSTKLHYALFTGGILESSDETTGVLDLAFKSTVRETVPPIGLFGTALGNQLIQGCLRVGFAFPVCSEQRDYLSEPLLSDPRANRSIREFTTFAFATRRDDLRAEREEEEQAIQMKIDYECFIPGTLFEHQFVLINPSELELSCFAHMLALWKERPYVGGKLASGHGWLRFHYECPYTPDEYCQYLSQNAATIRDLLNTMEGRLGVF